MSKDHGNITYLKPNNEKAVIHPNAKIGPHVEIGPKAIIGEHVEIGDGCKIGPNVIIDGYIKIGKNNRFYNCAAIINYNENCLLSIGDDNVFRENVSIDATEGNIKIGSNNLLQAYIQIESESQIGDHIVIGNFSRLGKGVMVEDKAIISGFCNIENKVRIGKIVMVGGYAKILKDIPPFILVDGDPLKAVGINVVGLRRNGIEAEVRSEIKKAYKILYRANLSIGEALVRIEREVLNVPEIQYFIQFVRGSEFNMNTILTL